MADQDKETPEQTEVKPPAKPGKMKTLLTMIITFGFLLETGILGWIFAPKLIHAVSQKAKTFGNENGQGSKKKSIPKGALPLEPFLVNLADASSTRYLRITMKLGLGIPQYVVAEKVIKDEVIIANVRNEILGILSAKKSDDLLTPEGKQKLREEIVGRLNGIGLDFEIRDVFFTELIVQL